jgi:ribonucleoside-diphosphate reductase beta chain
MPLMLPRNVYRPFEYQWAFDAYLKQNQAHWLATEVPMTDDVVDYRKNLSPEEKHLIMQVLRFFTQGDIEVQNNYQTRLMPMFPVPEVAMMLASFANTEAIHVHAYSYLIDTLGLPESEYKAFLDYEAMRTKYEYLHGFSNRSQHDLAKTLAVFGAFMEGTALFASFAILMNFPRQGKLRGLGQIISWSIRDESLHADSICKLYRTFLVENPDARTMKLEADVRRACISMVEMEDRFIDLCFEMGAVRGLAADEVKQYVRFTADKRLADLGMDPEFGVTANPLPWLATMINAKEHTNFFENRATDYSKANIDDTWPT